MLRAAAVAVLLLVSAGCPVPVCDPTETRCTGAAAEICGSDGVWRTLMDCSVEGMACCYVDADPDAGVPSGNTCLPSCPTPAGGD